MSDETQSRDGGTGTTVVFGASGYIGTNLVSRLIEAGRRVRAVARSRQVLEDRGWAGVSLVEADALRPETLSAALEGAEVAYYLVHSMAVGRHFADVDLIAADNFRTAAEQAGVKRIVYLGGVIPPDPKSRHLRSRKETGDRLRHGLVPVTEIRAGMIVGPGSAAFEVIRDLVNYLPVMVTPRWVSSKSCPIALHDLLEYLVRIPETERTAGRVYEAGGPEALTYEQLMRQYAEIVGKNPRILRVPVITPRLSSYWLNLVTSVPASIARALIDGLSQDVVVDDRELRKLFPISLMTFRQAVNAALEAERAERVLARWVEGSLACRNYRPRYSFYAKKAGGSTIARASERGLWLQVASIGGEQGYYYLNSLWVLRGMIDSLFGGPGLRRGRRHPSAVRVGDAIDAWRVLAVDEPRRLTLLLEMKLPGSAVLEFLIEPVQPGENRISATGYFHPAGVWGLMYWYALLPIHHFIFNGLTRAIARRAEAEPISGEHR